MGLIHSILNDCWCFGYNKTNEYVPMGRYNRSMSIGSYFGNEELDQDQDQFETETDDPHIIGIGDGLEDTSDDDDNTVVI